LGLAVLGAFHPLHAFGVRGVPQPPLDSKTAGANCARRSRTALTYRSSSPSIHPHKGGQIFNKKRVNAVLKYRIHSLFYSCFYFLGKNKFTFVPQFGHTPFAIRRPLALVTSLAFLIATFFLHFTQ
jgi:hypothetical protein